MSNRKKRLLGCFKSSASVYQNVSNENLIIGQTFHQNVLTILRYNKSLKRIQQSNPLPRLFVWIKDNEHAHNV